MSIFFTAGLEREGFDGAQAYKLDDDTDSQVIQPPASTLVFSQGNNAGYPQLIDNSAIAHNRQYGALLGDIRCQGPVAVDRGMHYLVTNAFGPRSTDPTKPALTPWLASLLPNAGGTVVNATGLFFSDLMLAAQFDVSGNGMAWSYQASAAVCDPNNVAESSSLTLPDSTLSELIGLGISTLFDTTFTDGDSTTYDSIRSVSVRLTNNLQVIKAAHPTLGSRIVKGFTPGLFMGRLTLVQNKGAAQAIPIANGTYEFQIAILSPDGSYLWTLKISASYDAQASAQMANDQNTVSGSYTIFGNAGSLSWPVTSTYAST